VARERRREVERAMIVILCDVILYLRFMCTLSLVLSSLSSQFTGVIKKVEPSLADAAVSELWGKVDVNGDGTLNYMEFIEIAPKLFSEFFTGDKPEWISCKTDDTPPATYYYNNKTGASTWDKPAGM
jgi:hypothetical protein|tara:strand:+ start:54 stop:434 length:381 start_codon:yes stop_codon:yes gene_type:complete